MGEGRAAAATNMYVNKTANRARYILKPPKKQGKALHSAESIPSFLDHPPPATCIRHGPTLRARPRPLFSFVASMLGCAENLSKPHDIPERSGSVAGRGFRSTTRTCHHRTPTASPRARIGCGGSGAAKMAATGMLLFSLPIRKPVSSALWHMVSVVPRRHTDCLHGVGARLITGS